MKFSEILNEARVESDKVEYKTLNKGGKPTDDKDRITKVVAVLSHQKGTAATKLIDTYEDIYLAKKKLDEQLEDMKGDMLEYTKNMFDESDRLYTNVIETASMTLTMSKETEKNTVKWDKFVEKLKALLPEMSTTFDAMIKEVTKMTPVASSLKPASKDEKEVNESVFSKIKDKLKGLVDAFVKKFSKKNDVFDEKVAELKALTK